MNQTTMDTSETLSSDAPVSIRDVWKISFPLMISTFASLFMIFVDRMFLSRYSLDALNASVNSGTWAWAFMCGIGMLTGISEVFVSQYNGAKKWEDIGKPVWQMVWIAFASYLFFIPLSIWGGGWIYSDTLYQNLQIDYFKILMMFAPCYALTTALSGFFIGRGKTKLLIWLAVGANLINIIMDRLLIFGVSNWIPEMGIRGAAIATSSGYFFEIVILFFLFLKKENREKYHTHKISFDRDTFLRCFRVGLPQAIFCTLEIIGFAVFYQMMTSLSELHITVSSICQSILIILSFFFDGLSRGVAAVAGNFIGARKFHKVKEVLKSGIFLQLFFSASILLFFLFDFEQVFQKLFPSLTSKKDPAELTKLFDSLTICLYATYFYVTFEGIRWVLSGILTAAGDTYFLLVAGTLGVWLFLLTPVYFIVVRKSLGVEVAWLLTVIYSALSCLLYWLRLYQGKWQQKDLLE